jgi:ADP-ribose pyrophosphatase YjhB (NUDIX family)
MWIEQIKQYIPYNEQEVKDKQAMLTCIEAFDDVLTRQNPICHMTVSSFVINKEHTHVLMAYHNLYNSWAWMGGHADGDYDFLHVAKKELAEESGVTAATPLSEDIFSIEVLNVLSHIKKGEFISSHLHLNVTYAFECDMDVELTIAEEENSQVGWIRIDELASKCDEPFMMPIYEKIIEKIEKHFNK